MIVRIDKRGRITLPTKIREELELKKNDMLMLDINEDGLLVGNPVVAVKRPKNYIHSEAATVLHSSEEVSKFLKNRSKSSKVTQK